MRSRASSAGRKWPPGSRACAACRRRSSSRGPTSPKSSPRRSPGSARCTCATRLVDLAGRDAGGRADAAAILEALGPAAGPPLLDLVRVAARGHEGQPHRRAVALRSRHARGALARGGARRRRQLDRRCSARSRASSASPATATKVRSASCSSSARRADRARRAAQPGQDRHAARRGARQRADRRRHSGGSAPRPKKRCGAFRGPRRTARSASCSDGANSSCATRRPPDACSTARRRAAPANLGRSCRRSCPSAIASGIPRSSASRGRPGCC